MRRHLLTFGVLVSLVLASPTAAVAERVALVVGNGAYLHTAQLANPANDAAAMADLLEELGFEVELGLDLEIEAMRETLTRFAAMAAGAELAFIFYAGHGLEVGGENWLVPVDARLANDLDLPFEAIGLDFVMDLAQAAAARVVVLDACRDNPLAAQMRTFSATRSVGRGLARVTTARGSLIAFATSPGAVAADGRGSNSPYTTALLEHLDEPGLSISDAMTNVTAAVQDATGGAQVPWTNSSLNSLLYLAAPAGPPPPPTPPTAEEIAWEAATADAGPPVRRAMLEAFLVEFPDSVYAPTARLMLAALEAQSTPLTTDPSGDGSAADAAPPAPEPSPAERAEAALALSSDDWRRVQAALARLGHDPGPADGVPGPRTRSAIADWQRAGDLEPTGRLDDATHRLLFAELEAARREAVAQARVENGAPASFFLRQVSFEGVTVYDARLLDRLAREVEGRVVQASDVEKLTESLRRQYARDGYGDVWIGFGETLGASDEVTIIVREGERRDLDVAAARELLAEAQELVKAGSYAKARAVLATIVEARPHEALVVEAAYWSAESYLREGYDDRAVKAFASNYASYGVGSPRAADSLVKMAEAYNNLGDAKSACAALARLRAQHGGDLAPSLASAVRNEYRRAGCR